MKLVIEIPDWMYKSICEGIEASKRCHVTGIDPIVHEAIASGIPLPKRHGELIDKDIVLDMMNFGILEEYITTMGGVIPAER